MDGAVLYATKYGSTAEYAEWIGEATGLTVLNVRTGDVDPDEYDFLILATPVIYYKLLITDWVKRNLSKLEGKPIVMVTVSGAPPGPKLDAWVGDSLPDDFVANAKHVGLRGRQIPAELTWFDRMMLIIAAWKNPDPVASEEELKGFDYMDKDSIAPVVALANELRSRIPAKMPTQTTTSGISWPGTDSPIGPTKMKPSGTVMTDLHPNTELLMQLNLRDLDASATLFSDDFIWHFFNPKLPELQGDYVGVDGLRAFFETMAEKTNGSFNAQPISVTPVGNELLVVHVRDKMDLEGASLETDAVVVWRIVNGQIAEAWDIPAVFTTPPPLANNETKTRDP